MEADGHSGKELEQGQRWSGEAIDADVVCGGGGGTSGGWWSRRDWACRGRSFPVSLYAPHGQHLYNHPPEGESAQMVARG